MKNERKKNRIDLQPFIEGLASLFDLYNARRPAFRFSFDDDLKAMKSDFDLVGHDLFFAFKKEEEFQRKRDSRRREKSNTRHSSPAL